MYCPIFKSLDSIHHYLVQDLCICTSVLPIFSSLVRVLVIKVMLKEILYFSMFQKNLHDTGFFFLNFLLRYNSQTIKFTTLNYAIQSCASYIHRIMQLILKHSYQSAKEIFSSHSPFSLLPSLWKPMINLLYLWTGLFWTFHINRIM